MRIIHTDGRIFLPLFYSEVTPKMQTKLLSHIYSQARIQDFDQGAGGENFRNKTFKRNLGTKVIYLGTKIARSIL